jgi:hypothetical protein
MTDDERQRFAVPLATGELDGIDLAFCDPDDEDARRILMLAEHPELHAAIKNDRSEIRTKGTTIRAVLHLALHEIIANQLRAHDPPEVWHTARRLIEAGYERHEVLHMLGSVVAERCLCRPSRRAAT